MYAISAIRNCEILDDTTTEGPALPTIGELNRPITTKFQWLWSGRRGLLFLPNGEFVAQVFLHLLIRPLLQAMYI